MIEANLFPPLIDLLRRAEFDVKKEAAWAISNATSGGDDGQLAYVSWVVFVVSLLLCLSVFFCSSVGLS